MELKNYINLKKTEKGNFIDLKKLDRASDFLARSVTSLLSSQPNQRDQATYLVNEEENTSVIYLNGTRIREFKQDRVIY